MPAGATKSASATFSCPSRFARCWRSVKKVASSAVRPSSVKRRMSSPTAFAGQKPIAARGRNQRSSITFASIACASSKSCRAAAP